jgi:hypothetical protein
MKYCIKKIALGLMLASLNINALENEEANKINMADIPVLVGAHFLLNIALGLAHQMGPIIAAKIFVMFGAEFSAQIEPETSDANVKLKGICLDTTVPEFKNELLNILMYGSAPLTGFLGCICALKTANVLSEYDKTKGFKKAFSNGLKKDLFNETQSPSLKGWVIAHLALNCFDCVPRLYPMEGGQIGGNAGAQIHYWAERYIRKSSK